MENKIGILARIAEIYETGGNIIQFLKGLNNQTKNNLEDILISYDFQAGSYIQYIKNNPNYINNYSQLIASEFDKLITNKSSSILEIGVGEGTMLANVVTKTKSTYSQILGTDISWSRIYYGNKYLNEQNISNYKLFTGDLFNLPLSDNSIDIVYTCHSLEPNGGREKEALIELYRVTKKYLVLFEPAYEFANEDVKKRMLEHGYVKNLVGIANELNYKIIENRLFELCENNLNPTQIIIIEKNSTSTVNFNNFYCPITKTPLEKGNGYYYSNEGMLVYPIIKNIPCLLPQNAIVATHLNDF